MVGFYGAFRFSEINRLTTHEVVISPGNNAVAIMVLKSKTDQYNEGRNRALSVNPYDALLCPVSVTLKYLSLLGPQYAGNMQPRQIPTGNLKMQILFFMS